MRYGEALPLLRVTSNRNPRFALGSMAGRFVLCCVIGDLTHADARVALQAFPRDHIDETHRLAAVFCADAQSANNADLLDISQRRLVFTDPDAARAGGLIDPREPAGRWILFDPTLRTLAFWPLVEGAAALSALANTPPPDQHAGAPLNAPVLVTPRIFELDFCRLLTASYERQGGQASGVTQESEAGKTVVRFADAFKRRSDWLVEDEALRQSIMQRIYWRLAPEIEKAFVWKPTRMERYLVACYDAEGGGFFKPHRDNTTAGTAHRRFAVTINLNTEEYEGGDLRFPEFGTRTYRAPTGGAIVFSCSLLHEATPVTRGRRYAFLPFLYDEAAAKQREANNQYLDESLQPYDAREPLG